MGFGTWDPESEIGNDAFLVTGTVPLSGKVQDVPYRLTVQGMEYKGQRTKGYSLFEIGTENFPV